MGDHSQLRRLLLLLQLHKLRQILVDSPSAAVAEIWSLDHCCTSSAAAESGTPRCAPVRSHSARSSSHFFSPIGCRRHHCHCRQLAAQSLSRRCFARSAFFPVVLSRSLLASFCSLTRAGRSLLLLLLSGAKGRFGRQRCRCSRFGCSYCRRTARTHSRAHTN